MRRLFIMRKDLNMSAGKLAAQVSHCAEAYWTRQITKNAAMEDDRYISSVCIDKDIYEQYLCGTFTKTICQARNLNHLLKAVDAAEELGLKEDIDFGLINDKCLTELVPENSDGTTTTGIWFKPLPDELAHYISKKYHLYT